MNILFIDNKFLLTNSKLKNYIYKTFGFYMQISRKQKINYLAINTEKLNSRVLGNIIKLLYKNRKVYIVLSKYVSDNTLIKEILDNNIKDKIFVTEQNNLYQNDIKYINKYITKNKLERKDIRVLFIIDNIKSIELKKKFEQFIKQYKVVDILITNKANYNKIKEYVDKINNEEGTSIEVLSKIRKQNYNIILVFTKNYDFKYNKTNSFILDYNNSDLDVESNTYLIYIKNEVHFKNIFNNLNMDISRFEKTKLGKLYIHASRLILDR